MLAKGAEETKKVLKFSLEGLTCRPSLTIDIWTDKGMRHSYLAATINYLDGSTLVTSFLGMYEIRGSHTGDLIRATIENCLEEFGLDMEKIFKVFSFFMRT